MRGAFRVGKLGPVRRPRRESETCFLPSLLARRRSVAATTTTTIANVPAHHHRRHQRLAKRSRYLTPLFRHRQLSELGPLYCANLSSLNFKPLDYICERFFTPTVPSRLRRQNSNFSQPVLKAKAPS
jgi:hypothetical protein